MKVKDIISQVCEFLGREDLLGFKILGGEKAEITVEAQKDLNKILSCFNLILNEIACDYIPLIYEETFKVENKSFKYNNFKKTMLDIISINTTNGLRATYRCFGEYIKIANGSYVINYSYLPDKLELADDVNDLYGNLNGRVLAYGVAMEYSLSISQLEEASIWEKRFKDSLFSAMRRKGEIRLPKRGWY